MLAREPERLVSVGAQDHVVALFREVVADQLGDVLLVLDEEHPPETLATRLTGSRQDPAPIRGHHVGLLWGAHRSNRSVGGEGYGTMTDG